MSEKPPPDVVLSWHEHTYTKHFLEMLDGVEDYILDELARTDEVNEMLRVQGRLTQVRGLIQMINDDKKEAEQNHERY